MSDAQYLYLVLLALYVMDGLVRLPRHSWLFVRSWWSKRWRLKRPLDMASRFGEGFALLPMGGILFPAGEGWWFSDQPDDNGKARLRWVDAPESQAVQAILTEERPLFQEDKRLFGVRGHGKWVLPNKTAASRLKQWTDGVFEGDSGEAISEQMDESLSLPRARAAKRKWKLISKRIGFAEFSLMIYVFGLLPILYPLVRLGPTAIYCVLLIFVMTMMIGVRWCAVVGRMFPQMKRQRWYKVLPIFFLPHHAMRTSQQLGFELTAGCHPLATGKVCLDEESFLSFASEYMRKLRYPLAAGIPGEVWKEKYARLTRFLERDCGLEKSQWENRQPQIEADSASFCPRCFSQFQEAGGSCGHCSDLSTIPFDKFENRSTAS